MCCHVINTTHYSHKWQSWHALLPLLEAMHSTDAFVEKFGEWLKSSIFSAEGVTQAMEDLHSSGQKAASVLSKAAAVMVEQLLIKAMSMPAAEKKALCEKLQSMIAGNKFGLQESSIHATLLAYMREHSN